MQHTQPTNHRRSQRVAALIAGVAGTIAASVVGLGLAGTADAANGPNLAGRVTINDGVPCFVHPCGPGYAGAVLQIWGPEGTFSAVTDAQGDYAVKVGLGRYTVSVVQPDWFADPGPQPSCPIVGVVVSRSDRAVANLQCEPPRHENGVISGTATFGVVVCTEGEEPCSVGSLPAAGAHVRLVGETDATETIADNEGRFAFTASAGKYDLVLVRPNGKDCDPRSVEVATGAAVHADLFCAH